MDELPMVRFSWCPSDVLRDHFLLYRSARAFVFVAADVVAAPADIQIYVVSLSSYLAFETNPGLQLRFGLWGPAVLVSWCIFVTLS